MLKAKDKKYIIYKKKSLLWSNMQWLLSIIFVLEWESTGRNERIKRSLRASHVQTLRLTMVDDTLNR